MQLKRHQSVLEYRGNFGHTINIFIMVMDMVAKPDIAMGMIWTS